MQNSTGLNLAVLTLNVSVGEYTIPASILIANSSEDCLEAFAEETAASYFGSDYNSKEGEGYYSLDKDAFVKVEQINPIQLKTYLELRAFTPCVEDDAALEILEEP